MERCDGYQGGVKGIKHECQLMECVMVMIIGKVLGSVGR